MIAHFGKQSYNVTVFVFMKLKVNNFDFSIGADFDASICECCEITWKILCCWVYLLEGC